MNISEILTRFPESKRVGSGWQVKCPVHDDRTASLSISNGGGKILIHCHAGCATEQIVGALGLRMADLFSEPKPVLPGSVPQSFKGSPVTACYEYRDGDGNLSYRVLRTADKNFVQQRLTDAGEWEWKGPAEKLLYRLPELLADDSDAPVFVVEGEKDADNLWRVGCLATCNSGGAGKFTQANEALAGRTVVILPDNDDAGRKHAEDVMRRLDGVAARVVVLDLSDLPGKGDVSDWLAAGGTKDELLRLADLALNPPPQVELFQPSETLLRPEELSLMGLAARFHARFYRTTRYVEARGVFYHYDRGVWNASRCAAEAKVKQIINEVHEIAESVEREIQQLEQRQQGGDNSVLPVLGARREYLEHLGKFLKQIKKPATMEGVLQFSRSDLVIGADDFDPAHGVFNCANGAIDLDAGQFRPHSSADLCSMQSPVEFDARATCPRWERFLREIFLEETSVIDFIQRAIGYSLSGHTSEQVFLILHGDGSNGKSELLYVLDRLLGDYLRAANVDTFMDDRPNGGHNEDIARLRGCRLVTTTETEKSKRLAEGLVKRLTGGDVITASFKHERTFQFIPQFKVWLAANHKPQINGTDYGIWRRILLVSFLAKFLKPGIDLGAGQFRIDPNLRRDLSRELPGILNWAIAGYRAWRDQGLDAPPSVKAASEEYRQESDKLGAFLTEEMIEGEQYFCPLKQAYAAYQRWCEEGGMRAMSSRALSSELRNRGIEVRKFGVKNDVCVVGYGLMMDGEN